MELPYRSLFAETSYPTTFILMCFTETTENGANFKDIDSYENNWKSFHKWSWSCHYLQEDSIDCYLMELKSFVSFSNSFFIWLILCFCLFILFCYLSFVLYPRYL